MTLILFALVFLTFIASLAASVSDFRTMLISNRISLAIIVFFAAAFVAAPAAFGAWYLHLAAGAIFLVVTFIMFALGMIGAGDAKYGAALALWVGLKGLMAYMFYMALIGGLLGVAAVILRRRKIFAAPAADSWIDRAQRGENAIPYGIAITVGAWAALFHTGFLSRLLDEVIRIISS